MPKTLRESLKEIQILLGKPHKRIAGVLKYYLSFLSVADNAKTTENANQKTGKIRSLSYGKITWVDVRNPSRKEVSELAEKYPFHPLHLEDCVSKGQFPKIEQNLEDKYLFILLRFPIYNNHSNSIIVNQICFFLGKNYLVSIHENLDGIVSQLFTECEENIDERKVCIGSSSARLLYTIIKRLVDSLSPLLLTILTEVDETEDIVFDDKISGIYKIGQLRRKILISRRIIGPLRNLLQDIGVKVNKFSSTNLSVYYDDITHQVSRAWETLEEARETVDIYKDADYTISSEKTNRILAVLTIFFTLSIPATLFGTYYGMNIHLPGGLTAPWDFWGQYTTFFIILLLSGGFAILMQIYFRKKGWF